MTTLTGLLGQTEEALRDRMIAATPEERLRLVAEIWDVIRRKGLYGGQPSSENSNHGLRLARLALSVAMEGSDQLFVLEAWCMMAYTLNANEQYGEALEFYPRAIEGLEGIQDHARAARTRLGYLTVLSMSGRHEEAIETGLLAEQWFLSNGDEEGYARLCVNLGNVCHRLDQHARSLKYHEEAIRYFTKTNHEQALGQAYLNAGNALGSLNRFEEADDLYASSEQIGERLSLSDLVAQARYNRAYLYFLRGRNMQAVEQFGKLRMSFEEGGSLRHAALCDLDETEIYLQLNLPNEAARLSQRAAQAFESLNMRYERARATTFLGIALTQNRQFGDALQVFRSAQSLFEEENNRHWVALVKFYRAEVLYAVGRLWEARSLAASAHDTFETTNVEGKRVVSMILLARVALDLNKQADVANYVPMILKSAMEESDPLVHFPCYAFCAYAAERAGDFDEAERLYELAAQDIENRSTHLQHDELRVPFYPQKQTVYGALARLALRNAARPDLGKAYVRCQQAKSTSMVDLVRHHLPSIRSHGDETVLSRVSRIRDELNSSYLRLRSEEGMPSLTNRSSIQIKESELLRSLRELSEVDPEYVALQCSSSAALERLQSVLPADRTVVEFFALDNEVVAFVISRDRVAIFRHLSPLARIRYLEDQLRSHFLKVSATATPGFDAISPEFANVQLGELYSRLIRPIRDEIQTPGLIILPHGVMHFIPFAALFDGKDYLLDHFNISHAPSAVFLRSSLNRTPLQSREFVHIAADVEFRLDNPMFSCLRCGDSQVTAVDLFSMSCPTNLVALSGTKFGFNPAAGPESMTAITEALLYSGARSVLTTLWNVDQATAGDFIESFYRDWRAGAAKCEAVRSAVMEIRRRDAHPFFWAPYVLIGEY